MSGLGKVVAFAGGSAGRLDSWKEIAAYLRRGARTVQRWEREQNLPVHRLRHDKLGSVYAYKSELDAWWSARREELENEPPAPQDEPSIAVLPFSDLSREKDQEYFCEGMAEEISGALARLDGLRVASRTSAFRFKSGGTDARELGRQLRVRTLLEGSVRKSGDKLRITVQLTSAETGYQLWTATYDRQMSDVFQVQEEIARSVTQALEVRLSPKETESLRAVPTNDVQAYDCYLRGRRFYYSYGARDIEFAIQLFTRATSLDPRYALAYTGLADCWSYIYLYSERSNTVREQADWASARAIELAPESAQAHASRALALSLAGKDPEAEAEFETARRLDPGLFEAYYFHARHAFVHGEWERAASLFEQAMRVRPEDYQSPLLVGQIYDHLGRDDEARAARVRGISVAEQHLALNPDDVRALYMGANGMAALGRREEGKEWVRRALSLRPDDPMVLYNAGCIYALLRSTEDAVTCLERAARNGITEKGWFEHDSNLDSLRSHPRFLALMQSL